MTIQPYRAVVKPTMLKTLLFPDEDTETAWLVGLRQDDAAAFNAIYGFFSRYVFTAAYNYCRDEDMAREVVQEVFVQLWEQRHRMLITGRLGHYLYGMARHQIYRTLNQQARHHHHAQAAAQRLPGSENTTEEQVAFEEALQLIEQHLKGLGDTTRRVFLMSRFEGSSVVEIATALSISPKAVEYHITKALRVLKAGLGNLTVMAAVVLFSLVN